MSIRLDKILCATDFSQFSTVALHCGVNLAHQFNSHLLVSHTVCFPRNQIYGTAAYTRGGEQEEKAEYAFKKINHIGHIIFVCHVAAMASPGINFCP